MYYIPNASGCLYICCFVIVSCVLLYLSVHLLSGSCVRLLASIDVPSVSKFPQHVANIQRSQTTSKPGFLWGSFNFAQKELYD